MNLLPKFTRSPAIALAKPSPLLFRIARGTTSMPRYTRLLLTSVLFAFPMSPASAGDLGGSPSSMEEQHEAAIEADYSFLRKPADVKHLVTLGRLVEARGNEDYTLSKVSFPYTRPEVLSFIEHFALAYRERWGSRLVVTSLTRPSSLQPRNAHELSVHPAGMAVDLRVPGNADVRRWFERELLALEDADAIDVTREKNPPHYHIAVFADRYLPIAARQDSLRAIAKARADSLERVRVAAAADSAAVVAARQKGSRLPMILAGLIGLVAIPVARRRHRRRADDHGSSA